MLPNQRRDKILELLKEDGSAKVADLAKANGNAFITIEGHTDASGNPAKPSVSAFMLPANPAMAADIAKAESL